jgi:acyl-CoA hydrolase
MKKQYQAVTAEEAVKVIKSGDHVHISSVSNVPQCLVKALCDRGRAGELKNVYIHHLHTEGAAPYVQPEFEGIFQHNAFFVGSNVRESVQKGLADYIPVFLGETSKLYRERYIKCNVAMIQVCPPDKFGYVSLGPSVDATLAAMESAEFVIAVVNKYVPRTFGDALVHISRINVFVEDDTSLLTVDMPEPNEVEKTKGGRYHGQQQEAQQRQNSLNFCDGFTENLQFHRWQSRSVADGRGIHQRPLHHRTTTQDDFHKLWHSD